MRLHCTGSPSGAGSVHLLCSMAATARSHRLGGLAFLQRARNGIQGGFQFRPPWFDAMVQHQPLPLPKGQGEAGVMGLGVPFFPWPLNRLLPSGKLRPLSYPEDRLIARLQRDHPELWTNTVINMIPDDHGRVLYKHPASLFVERQRHWMSQGRTEEEAFQATLEDWRRQKRFERVELRVAMVQAVQLRGLPDVDHVRDPMEERYAKRWQEALEASAAKDAQERRERLEAMLEDRSQGDARTEADGVPPPPVDLLALEPDVTQEDLDTLLASDQRAQLHFGGTANHFDLEIERMLPRPGDADYDEFRDFLAQELPEDLRASLASENPAQLPAERHAHYFKELDARPAIYRPVPPPVPEVELEDAAPPPEETPKPKAKSAPSKGGKGGKGAASKKSKGGKK